MSRLLIVEDEPAIQNGIMAMIPDLNLPLQIVGACFNGKSAMESLETLKPDIVLTDIKMPGMNGLELIQKSREVMPSIEYIILSGYSDFEYVRTAMQYGVNDYILKPFTYQEFREVMKKVCEKVENKKMYNYRRYIQELLFNNHPEKNKEAEVPGKYRCHYLALLCLGAFSVRSVDFITPDYTVWNAPEIEKRINDKMGQSGQCCVLDARVTNEKIVFLSVTDESVMHVKRFVNEASNYAKELDMPLTIALSNPFEDIEQLNKIHHEARINLSNRIVLGKSSVIIPEDTAPIENYVAINSQQRKSIHELLGNENLAGVIDQFLLLAEEWKKARLPQVICEFSAKYLVSEIYNRYDFLQKLYFLEDLLSKVEQVVCSSAGFGDFKEGIAGLMRDIEEDVVRSKVNLNVHEVVERIYQYICQHYTEAVSFEQLSRKFGYHASYISNTFTGIKGISPMKLMTNLRIAKAREMLADSKWPLKEIAAMTGYNDVNYFSRIFKEVVGVSPKQYRKNIRQGDVDKI